MCPASPTPLPPPCTSTQTHRLQQLPPDDSIASAYPVKHTKPIKMGKTQQNPKPLLAGIQHDPGPTLWKVLPLPDNKQWGTM